MAIDRHSQPQRRVTGSHASNTRAEVRVLWIYPPLIALAEFVTVLSDPQLGLFAHTLVAILLVAHFALADDRAKQQLTLTLLLAPIVRVLSLTMPLDRLPQAVWHGLLALPLLLAAWLVVQRLRLSRRELGLQPGNPLIQLLIAGGGLGLGAASYALLGPAPFGGDPAGRIVLLPALLLMLSSGLTEELIFRGIVQAAAVRHLGRWALIYGSLVFAALQISHSSPAYMLLMTCAGLAFAYTVRWSGSIAGVGLAHGLATITLLVLMPAIGANPDSLAARFAPWVFGATSTLALGAFGMLLARAVSRPSSARSQPRSAPLVPAGASRAIRDLRNGAGLTYVGLALRCGLPARLLAEVEYGIQPLAPEQLEMIAAGLGVSPQRLLGAGGA